MGLLQDLGASVEEGEKEGLVQDSRRVSIGVRLGPCDFPGVGLSD